jgi:hypothetical protein
MVRLGVVGELMIRRHNWVLGYQRYLDIMNRGVEPA